MTIWLATLLSLALSPTCAQRAESGLPAATARPQDLVFDQQHRRWSEVLTTPGAAPGMAERPAARRAALASVSRWSSVWSCWNTAALTNG